MEEQAADYGDEFVMRDDETLADVLAAFEAAERRDDPAGRDRRPRRGRCRFHSDVPWFPKDVPAWSVRWVVFHLIEELARHAGQGDIIRESIDGATLYELLAGLEGWPRDRLAHAVGQGNRRRR